MAGLVGIRAEDMEQVDALKRARLDWPQGLPFIRPSVLAPALVRRGNELEAVPARFGFTRRFSSFNARDDKLATSPFWRTLFGKHHGILALSYVVEWIERDGTKQPYLIKRHDGKLMMVPALVGTSRDSKDEMAFALCTRTPNRFFALFHDRMVGVLTPDLTDRWLHPEGESAARLLECVRAPSDEELVAVPASPDVQKRKSGDWSPVATIGPPLTWNDLKKDGRADVKTQS